MLEAASARVPASLAIASFPGSPTSLLASLSSLLRRYVTPGAFLESAAFAGFGEEQCRDWELLARVRYAVYKPGGPMAVELAKNPTVLVVNDTAFAHGGLLPTHGEQRHASAGLNLCCPPAGVRVLRACSI